jgi:hypothetical protein
MRQSPSDPAVRGAGAGIRDVPSSRLGGAVMITDGQVHDVPGSLGLPLDAPLHGLIVGDDPTSSTARSSSFAARALASSAKIRRSSTASAMTAPHHRRAGLVTVRVNGDEIAPKPPSPARRHRFISISTAPATNIVEFSVDELTAR